MRVTRRRNRSLLVAAAAGLAATALTAGAAPARATVAPKAAPVVRHTKVDPWITERLGGTADISLLVHATDEAAAIAAIRAAGLPVGLRFPEYGVVATVGAPSAVRSLATAAGVTHLEGNRPLSYSLDTSHVATRGQTAIDGLPTATGTTSFDGSGVTIAVIDSGLDPLHPFFTLPDGSSKVVVNRKVACGPGTSLGDIFVPGLEQDTADACVQDAGIASTDDSAAGGHGSHVNGIAAGVDVDITSDLDAAVVKHIHGAAPGAKLASFSAGAGLNILGATTAFYWIKLHHADPCGDGSCPPIKVVSNSYGPTGGGDFDPDNLYVQVQEDLVDAGVVSVWAAGNDGNQDDATTAADENATNPPGQDPKPGIIQVANYDDKAIGTRDNQLDTSSSRGRKGEPATYPDISAPGANITSSCKPELPVCSTGLDPYEAGYYNTISGTSMATPHIAGIVAQLFQANPNATPAQIELALVDTAYKYKADAATVAAAYPDTDTRNPASTTKTSFDKGHGLVDVVAALHAIRSDIVAVPYVDNGPVCVADGSYTDAEGDATQAFLPQTAGALPNEPSLDILRVRQARVPSAFADSAKGDLQLTMLVKDMVDTAPSGSTGRYFRFGFHVGTTTYSGIVRQDIPATGATTIGASLSRTLTGTTSMATTLMSTTSTSTAPQAKMISGAISSTAETITLRFSLQALNTLETAAGSPSGFGDSTVLTTLTSIAQRQLTNSTPTADEAAGPCPFALAAASVTPPATVPEVPVGIVLPVAFLTLLGGAAFVTRRRRPADAA